MLGGGSSDSPPSLRPFYLPVTALLRSGWSTGQQLTLRLAVDWSEGLTSSGRSALVSLSPSARTKLHTETHTHRMEIMTL